MAPLRFMYQINKHTIMIENKFLYFQTYSDFKNKLDAGQINENSIAFIEDLSLIWTHGNTFGLTSDNLNEEDLSIVNDKIQFADKDFDPSVFSGLGRKYLRKNIVSRQGDDSSSDDSGQLYESSEAWVVYTAQSQDILVFYSNGKFYLPHVKENEGGTLRDCVIRIDVDDVARAHCVYFTLSDSTIVEDLALDYSLQYLQFNTDTLEISMPDGSTVNANHVVSYGYPFDKWNNYSYFINLLDDTMVNTPNTVYVVQYDYDLDGTILAIPKNCVLYFDGGSIFNGTLIGQNTLVIYGKHKDECFKNVQLLGTWVSNDGPDLPIYAGSGSSSLKLNTTDNTASGTNSVAEGSLTTASGMASHAEGWNGSSVGEASHSEGKSSSNSGITTSSSQADVIVARSRSSFGIAYGIGSHNEGNDTVALGDYSHAEGEGTNATGQGSHSEGKSTNPIPEGTIAANLKSKWGTTKFSCAWGLNSHAEGKDCLAEGDYSHSEGTSNYAGGNSSHAEGNGTTAANQYEHAEGQYNKSNTGTRHSVGIGTSSSNRKNAFEIMSDGKAFFYNLGGYNGTNPTAMDVKPIQAIITELLTTAICNIYVESGNTPDNIMYQIFAKDYDRQVLWDFVDSVYNHNHRTLTFNIGDGGEHASIEVPYIAKYTIDSEFVDFTFKFPLTFNVDDYYDEEHIQLSFNTITCKLKADTNPNVLIQDLQFSIV